MQRTKDEILHYRAREVGRIEKSAKKAAALVYPSPYAAGTASLGFQQIYRIFNEMPDACAERAYAPDASTTEGPLLTYESLRPVSDFSVVAFSVAYELELAGFFDCLHRAGIPALQSERQSHHPLVVVGGPLTFSNPVPLGPFADVIVMGEAEDLIAPMLDAVFELPRSEALRVLAQTPGFYVPTLHGEVLLPVAKATDERLPARSVITSPNSALSDMFLTEVERGCSRACSFCVMRRSTNGGMRKVDPERILAGIPEHVRRVGLVGAAVSDHPRIEQIVTRIVDSGRGVGLSSLRSDRLTPSFVNALKRGGYKTLTVASDGASERLRVGLEKRIREKHLLHATKMASEAQMQCLKVYMMLGVPGETDEDVEELADFSLRQHALLQGVTRLSLGVAPFVAKRNTPLDRTPFAGIKVVERRLKRLRKRLQGKVEVRPVSARWAWVEYQLAQGGWEQGLAAFSAWQSGGRFADWKRAFKERPAPRADNELNVALHVPKRSKRTPGIFVPDVDAPVVGPI